MRVNQCARPGCRIPGVAEPARSRISISAEFLHQQRRKLGPMLLGRRGSRVPPMPVICGRETAIGEASTDQRRITRIPRSRFFGVRQTVGACA
jgi:hypothetical protein